MAAGEWDREEIVIQIVGIGMARGMEPAQETDLKMGPDTGPKKAPEPGTVTAQVVKKGRAAEREGIRGMKVLLREDLHFLLHHAIFLEFLMQGLAGDPQTPGSLALISIGEFKGLQYGPLFHLL